MFVDATGRRRRLVRRIAYAVGAAGLTYTCLVAASVLGHSPRQSALGLYPPPSARPVPTVSPTAPPERATTGVPFPFIDRATVEAVPMRLQSRAPERQPTPRPASPPASPRPESTPVPTPSTPQPPTEPTAPTEPPPDPDPTDPPPIPTNPPTPAPTEPPTREPTPDPPAQDPPAELPVVGPILDLLTGSAR